MSEGIPAMWMRGGTSKGLYFLREDIPANKVKDSKYYFKNRLLQQFLTN